jgi:glucose/arabinose dehydrogenase
MGGALAFGDDDYLYVSTGDGTSFNFADPRAVRVQDLQNLSGKILKIDVRNFDQQNGAPGAPDNPFFDPDNPFSNESKVFYSGFRNPWRLAIDPVTGLPIVSDVGWFSFEELNTGEPGVNFGWPYFEGEQRTPGYDELDQALSFYANGNINPGSPSASPAVFPFLSQSHGEPDFANAIMVGDFFDQNQLIFGDVVDGTYYLALLDSDRNIADVQLLDSQIRYVTDFEMSPDGRLYGVNLVAGTVLEWEPI